MNRSEQKAFDEWLKDSNFLGAAPHEMYDLVSNAFEAGINYKRKSGKSERFEEFWTRYPVKVKKIPCRTTWKRKNLDKKIDVILADLTKRMEDQRWQDGYIPDPTTYLNQERWTDEVTKRPTVKKEPRTNDEWAAEGRKLGLFPGVGELWPAFKDRVRARL